MVHINLNFTRLCQLRKRAPSIRSVLAQPVMHLSNWYQQVPTCGYAVGWVWDRQPIYYAWFYELSKALVLLPTAVEALDAHWSFVCFFYISNYKMRILCCIYVNTNFTSIVVDGVRGIAIAKSVLGASKLKITLREIEESLITEPISIEPVIWS